jgi:hypothetical protein
MTIEGYSCGGRTLDFGREFPIWIPSFEATPFKVHKLLLGVLGDFLFISILHHQHEVSSASLASVCSRATSYGYLPHLPPYPL